MKDIKLSISFRKQFKSKKKTCDFLFWLCLVAILKKDLEVLEFLPHLKLSTALF
jgi:hypothetical protein